MCAGVRTTNARCYLGRCVRAFPESHQGLGKVRVGVHGDVPGDVVENVRLRQIVELVGASNCDCGGEAPVAQTIEEHEGGHISAHSLGLESSQGTKEPINVSEARDAIGIET